MIGIQKRAEEAYRHLAWHWQREIAGGKMTPKGGGMKSIFLSLVIVACSVMAYTSAGASPGIDTDTNAGYVCVGGYLYNPSGHKEYVGSTECRTAIIKGNFACISGYLYNPDGSKTYVGTSDCQSSNLGGGYACVSGYLIKPDGNKEYVGTSECQEAKLGNGYACVSGYLYMPNGHKEYVGSSECASSNFGH